MENDLRREIEFKTDMYIKYMDSSVSKGAPLYEEIK